MPKKPEGIRKFCFEHIEIKSSKKLYAKEIMSHEGDLI